MSFVRLWCYFLDYCLLRAVLRGLTTGAFLLFLYFVLTYIFNPPESMNFLGFLDTQVNWKNLGIIFAVAYFSFLTDYFNGILPDKLSNSVGKWLSSRLKGTVANYFVEMHIKRVTINSSLVPITELDEFIHHLYSKTSGEIFLFNPSNGLADLNDESWKDVRETIRSNSSHINKITIWHMKGEFTDVRELQGALGLAPEKITFNAIQKKHLNLAKQCRFAIYYKALSKKQAPKIEYFIYRSKMEPFFDGQVLILNGVALDSLRMPMKDKRFYDVVTEMKDKLRSET